MFTDPVWWFYLTWLPSYQRERGVMLASAAGALLVIYLAADLGSAFGGWMPALFLRSGWSGTRARLVTMALFAAGLPVLALGVMAKDLWTAVAFISVATACHQAWSADMFIVASDAFPTRAVGSVLGFGGMCGGIGGMLMLLVAGGMLQWLGNFTPLFLFAGVMHPLAWIAIRALVGKNITQIDLDKGLRTERSPALLAMGLGLMAVGAALVFANWSYILSGDEELRRRRREPARPDGARAGLREPRSPARCRPFGGVIGRGAASAASKALPLSRSVRRTWVRSRRARS